MEPRHADFIVADDPSPPAVADPRWRPTELPDVRKGSVVWYLVDFDRPPASVGEPAALYLPYLYRGGKVWLDGELVAVIQEPSEATWVRWARPHLLPLPASGLHAGRNTLLLRLALAADTTFVHMPRPAIGAQARLQPAFDRRFFWVRTVPWVTVVAGAGVSLFFLLVWWRRRSEILYGLFGMAVLLWAVRTHTFVFDTLPAAWWPAWRFAYHLSTGGSVVFMALFALALAGWWRRGVAIGLLAYWLIGPAVFLLAGARSDE